MKVIAGYVAFAALVSGAHPSLAEDFETRIVSGSVQLGGEIVIAVRDGDSTVPENATCELDLPQPFADHVETVSNNCAALTLQQGFAPITDAEGYAIPSAEVPYELIVRGASGAEVGKVSGVFPYNNQFSDLRILIKDVRNPVTAGQSFEAVVLGAGSPIAPSLTCRWNLYGPVKFEPSSENECIGTLTAQPPDGRDASMDVEIVNLTDMHAVGYATAKMLVK